MTIGLKALAGTILFAAAGWAQAPTIGGLANNYSYVAAGLPNYGIAQGSIFDIFGTNLVSSPAPLQDPSKSPLTSTLNGVTVNVTVGSTVTHPLLYSLFHGNPDEIAAVLPSTTPVGTGTITVTTSAGTSASYPIVVVQSAFGILALSGYGSGMGAIQDANRNYQLLSLTSSAKPGDVLVIWGSGLGPVTGDESGPQQQQDFGANMPIEVDVGATSAAIAYHGRSVFPGLDEVIFTMPANVSGCNVSLVVRSKNNNLVSNVVTVPVAADGGTCSDPTSPLSTTSLQKCASNGCTLGVIALGKGTVTTQTQVFSGITIPGSTSTADSITADFYRYTPAQFATGSYYGPSAVSIGSCSVYSLSFNSQTAPSVPTGATATPLSAGTITATTPSTTVTLPYQKGFYSDISTTGGFIPATGGHFSFTNTGADIGVFSGAQIDMAAPLVWTNPPTTVSRSAGLTLNWTGGTPGTYVTISGLSETTLPNSTSTYVAAYFWCNAPVDAKTFTVPSTVLLSLPPSGSITESGFSIPLPGSLSLINVGAYTTFTAPNLDFGYIGGGYTTTETLTYQ